MKKNVIYTSNLIKKLNFLFLVLSLSCTFFFSQDLVKSHYGNKNVRLFDKNTYDLSEFKEKHKYPVGLDVLNVIDEKYHSHPDIGFSVHPNNKEAIELIDKRDFYQSAYILPDGKYIFSSSKDPLNYKDQNGDFREIRYELESNPHGKNYRAGNQPIPKVINTEEGSTLFETPIGNIKINQRTKLRYYKGFDEIGSIHVLDVSDNSIGSNGLFIKNAFPSVDMQTILMEKGHVKTNYILNDKNIIPQDAEYMVFEDIITLPRGLHFEFDSEKGINNGILEDWEGELVIRDGNGVDVFHYMAPFIYDDHYTNALVNTPSATFGNPSEGTEDPGVNSDSFSWSSYRVEKIDEFNYKVSVIVKVDWLLSDERSYPIVIDPTTFTGTTLNIAGLCARRVSGSMPDDNFPPLPIGAVPVGCYGTTTVLPAGYMLLSGTPSNVRAGYKTRGCAASSTWMKFVGPCGRYPREAGFYYFCNTNLTNVDCGAPGAGFDINGVASRCLFDGDGEPCVTATPPLCADRTITFYICYQTRCFAQPAGTCAQTSAVNGTNYVEAGITNFRVDVTAEKILITLAGAPASGANVCPNTTVPLTLTTRYGVPNGLSTANCTDQMGGTYSWTASCTGGALSATSGTTSTTGTFSPAVTWNSGVVPGTYTITVQVCNTACPAPAGTMCDSKVLTYTVGNSIPPVVSDIDVCNGLAAVPQVSNFQAGYTYTWYSDAAGTVLKSTDNTDPITASYAAVNGTTQTYSVKVTAPCVSTLTTFTITWGPLTDPVVTDDSKCPGQLATLMADCGPTCRWYTASSGGAAIATGGTYSETVTGPITYYVENYVAAGCISTRVPVTISTDALNVTTTASVYNPICPTNTANFSASVTGNTDVASVPVTNAGSETINDNVLLPCTGPDCTAANSGALTVSTPAGVNNPLINTSIQKVCFTISGNGAWCGAQLKFLLTSPAGTTFTLFSGRAKCSKADNGGTGTSDYCFDDISSGTYPNPAGPSYMAVSGTYVADGGGLSNAFVGEAAALGSTWTLYVVDQLILGCGSGTASISNFTITFGVSQPPTYAWSGGPVGGSLSATNISNPVFTPPTTGGAFNSNYTVTVTDATGCTGSAGINVVCPINLPIELLSFYGDVGDRYNYLYWKTASETNSDYVNLERASDAANFVSIASFDAAGNSIQLKEYDYVDKNRLEGKNYYRLKMVDLNGDFKTSDIILLENKVSEIDLKALPNPANSYIDIVYNVSNNTESTIKIYDSKGKLIENISKNSKKGVNTLTLDLKNYSDGIYNIVLNQNGISSTSRFVKQ